MTLRKKRFGELTAEELYAVLRLRVSVFVVEQKCPYMELDDLDQGAIPRVQSETSDFSEVFRCLLPSAARQRLHDFYSLILSFACQ